MFILGRNRSHGIAAWMICSLFEYLNNIHLHPSTTEHKNEELSKVLTHRATRTHFWKWTHIRRTQTLGSSLLSQQIVEGPAEELWTLINRNSLDDKCLNHTWLFTDPQQYPGIIQANLTVYKKDHALLLLGHLEKCPIHKDRNNFDKKRKVYKWYLAHRSIRNTNRTSSEPQNTHTHTPTLYEPILQPLSYSWIVEKHSLQIIVRHGKELLIEKMSSIPFVIFFWILWKQLKYLIVSSINELHEYCNVGVII